MDDWLIVLLISAEAIFDLLAVTWMTKHILLKAFEHPTPATERAFAGLFVQLWSALMTPSVEVSTGKKDEDGDEIKKKVAPFEIIVRAAGESVVARLRGLQGAVERDGNALLGLPRKGQSTQEYLLEQLGNRLMPVIQSKIEEKLKGGGQFGGL